MTTPRVVTDDRKIPTVEEVNTYTRREAELKVRFLKGVLAISEVLDGLQELMEMSVGRVNCNTQPEIPSWANRANPIIQHIPCGMIDPARLATASVFQEGEYTLDGEEFVIRAQKLPGAMNACAFDFYAREENWKYLPNAVDFIVFANTVFRDSGGDRFVRCLCRHGARWCRYYFWLGRGFYRYYRVAVLASSP